MIYNCLWLMDMMLGIIPFYARIIVRIPSELQVGFGSEPRLNIGNSVYVLLQDYECIDWWNF